jgi:hypothetical protein
MVGVVRARYAAQRPRGLTMDADAIIRRVLDEVGQDASPWLLARIPLTAALVAQLEAEHDLREMSRMENTRCGCFDEEPFVFAAEDWAAAHKKHNDAYAAVTAILEGSETP